jgi:hypothetical protein
MTYGQLLTHRSWPTWRDPGLTFRQRLRYFVLGTRTEIVAKERCYDLINIPDSKI